MLSEYRIAGISVQVDAPTELKDDDAFALYRVAPNTLPPAKYSFQIKLICDEQFIPPAFDGQPVFADLMHLVLQKDERCLHLFRIPMTKPVSAWNWIESGNRLELHYHPEAAPYYLSAIGCFNAACFERVLYSQQMYLFHCSFIEDRGEAVLFSAPSGGGKTTQAMLWEQYGNAVMVNGDRAALEETDGKYIAHGLPIAGSSGVFLNRSMPIRAVFVVKKSEEDKTTRLSHQEAFEALFSELTLNTWNSAFVLDAVDFAMHMAETVPVFRLDCRIDRGAVEAAKAAMDSLT